jgi:tripartite-type tricarboxylate transporter receptor subunit TctC
VTVRKISIAALLLAALFSVVGGALAQQFPNKPIRLIAPFSPGGTLDLVARGVGQKLSEQLGQPVVVENRAGASGAIGSEAVAKAPPDGYTLLLGATTTHGINPALNPKLPYNAVTDFTAISLVATAPHVLVVHPAVPASTLHEFVRLAKAKPGMAFGSAGNGSPHHLAVEMLKIMAGIDVVHVPYKGAGPAMADLLGGQVQFMSVEMSGAEPHIRSGKIRPLAIATARRAPGIDLPTFAESGYPGFEVMAWYAVFGPPGMPEPVLARLNAEIVQGVATPDLRERFQKLGATPVGSSSAELAAHVKAEVARWTGVVQTAGIKLE